MDKNIRDFKLFLLTNNKLIKVYLEDDLNKSLKVLYEIYFKKYKFRLFENYLEIIIKYCIEKIYEEGGFVIYMDDKLENRLTKFIKSMLLKLIKYRKKGRGKETGFRKKPLKRNICLLFSCFFIFSNYPSCSNINTLINYTYSLFKCEKENREWRIFQNMIKNYKKEFKNLFTFKKEEILYYYENIIKRFVFLICKQSNIELDPEKLDKVCNLLLELVRKYYDEIFKNDEQEYKILYNIFEKSIKSINPEEYPDIKEILDEVIQKHTVFMKNVNILKKRKIKI